ncbi:SRPBCC family protein [Tengunoibacter tsumagoiensis]|uniref:SRPBCC family protein n=1 Tax=Tengunoibacter tsumagoiensis TaxID=2014871 RepID=A0A402A5D4_9CHLR|nr:SRPBCC family protein [Tengunoibacter tsumagoiensis]GCE14363.1 hypothetical protein KTT_42220 [Tengunoibacter tsumagoiensis]
MGEYEKTITIQAPRKKIEEFVLNLRNLPQYVPTTKKAMPQQGEHVRVQGTAHGHSYDADGYFRTDPARHRMEWGSDGEEKYSGWLECQGADDHGPSQVTVHLTFDPLPGMSKELAQQTGSQDSTIVEGLEKSLLSIKNIVEGHGGKVEYTR